ncbi:MAG: hypothetical protein KatS3mg081_2233 [Gemmatimonadales bacterium]|nr:HTH-type transcriptional repressor [bacterium HR33]GIW52878.1 MAG: hypothetical protein KatS3mg081_2233 [Gemmatimonadales bacterium]
MINQKVEASKGRILHAARAEFAERGFDGARVARIAQLAGVNKQLLFHYFGSKTGLYAAAVRQALGELSSALRLEESVPSVPPSFGVRQPPSSSAPDRLRAEARRVLSVLGERRDLVRLVLLDVLRSGGPLQETGEFLGSLAFLFSRPLSEGQGLGFFRDDVDPDLASVQILVSILGFLGFEPALPAGGSDRREGWIEASVDLWVRGMGW